MEEPKPGERRKSSIPPSRTKSEIDLRSIGHLGSRSLTPKSSKGANLRHYVSSQSKVNPDELLSYARSHPSPEEVRLRHKNNAERIKTTSGTITSNSRELQQQRRKSYHFENPKKNENEISPEKSFQVTEAIRLTIINRLKDLYNIKSTSSFPLLGLEKIDLEENFSESLLNVVPDSRGQFQKCFISLEDIFTRIPVLHTTFGSADIPPLKVLLEGYAGFGKTTLTSKLALDWSLGRPYLAEQFEFVFVIQLRHLEGTIEGFLSSQLKLPDITPLMVQRILKRIQGDTLLILDGYDELRSTAKQTLSPILHGSKYSKMHVFVTSRPGMGLIRSYLSERHSSKTFTIPWGKIVFLTGIAEERQKRFLTKNLSSESTVDIVYNRIQEEANEEMKEIYKCPLFLKLLTLLIRRYKVTIVTSKTELYKKVITVMITQCLQQEKIVDGDINIFDPLPPKEQREFYHNLLLTLGKLALASLTDKTFFYSKEEVLKYCKHDERVFKLGLLTKTETVQKETQVEYYEPIHKSFLEFLAAFYLSTLDSDKRAEKHSLFVSTVNNLMEKEVQPTNGSLFYQFLGGILGAKTEILFTAISPWSFRYFATKYRDYSYDSYHLFYPIWCILSEVNISENLLVSLMPFVPALWEVKKQKDSTKFFTSALHGQLLGIGTETNRIHFFGWHVDEPANLPERLKVNIMKLEIGNSLNRARESLHGKHITCNELICEFVMGFDANKWKHFLKILSHIRMQKLNIIVASETVESVIPSLCEELVSGKLRELAINRLSCSLIQTKHRFAVILIRKLIEKKKLTGGLQIRIQRASDDATNSQIENKDVESIFTTAGASTTLRELSVINLWSDLDLKVKLESLCVQDKVWTFLPIHNKTDFIISQKIRKSLLVEEIEIDRAKDVNVDILILSFTDGVKRLKCRSELFYALTLAMPSWTGFQTITELNLKIADDTYHEKHFNALSNLKNLQALSLDLYWVKYDVQDDEESHKQSVTLSGSDADSLTSTLLSTRLKYLEFSDVGGWNVPFVNRILQGLLDKQQARERNRKGQSSLNKGKRIPSMTSPHQSIIQLRVLKVQFHDISGDDMLELINMFKKYLLKNLSKKIVFLDPNEAQIKQILNGFRFKDGFEIHRGVEGLDAEDTLRVQKEFLYTDADPKDQLTVMLKTDEAINTIIKETIL